MASVITAIVTALLATVIFALVQVAVCKCLRPNFTPVAMEAEERPPANLPMQARPPASLPQARPPASLPQAIPTAGVNDREYEVIDGDEDWEGSAIELEENRAYNGGSTFQLVENGAYHLH